VPARKVGGDVAVTDVKGKQGGPTNRAVRMVAAYRVRAAGKHPESLIANRVEIRQFGNRF
jgi:hypothetical protein